VAAVNVPPGCCETIMNHQNATVTLRRASMLFSIDPSSLEA